MRSPVSRFEKLAGYFIVVSILILVALIVVPRWAGLRKEWKDDEGFWGFISRTNFKVDVIAEDAEDLAAGDPVRMKGIQVGEVYSVDLYEKQEVKLTCKIYMKHVKDIPSDSEFYIVPAAVVGRGHIDIRQGSSEKPLPPGAEKRGLKNISITDQVNDVLVQVTGLLTQMSKILEKAGQTLEDSNRRVNELQTTLMAFQKILDQVASGKGSLGKLVYEEELYDRITTLMGRLEKSAGSFEKIRDPLTDFGEKLPTLSDTIFEVGGKLNRTLTHVEKGMENFPETSEKLVTTLTEGRKILESLKRNFLIRGNLPRDSEPTTMAPASRREPVSVD